jgi:hypothetical protein
MLRVDVTLQELARWWLLVDVDLLNVDARCVQKTSGIFASRSGGLRVERGLHTILLRF